MASGEPLKHVTKVSQICIVTGSIEHAMEMWSDKYGLEEPWSIYEFGSEKLKDTTVDEEPAKWGMRTASTTLGDLYLELIEPLDEDSQYARSLREHGGRD